MMERMTQSTRQLLSRRQQEVVQVIREYCGTVKEPCPGAYIARRLRLNPATVREHLSAIYLKGWTKTPTPPASLIE